MTISKESTIESKHVAIVNSSIIYTISKFQGFLSENQNFITTILKEVFLCIDYEKDFDIKGIQLMAMNNFCEIVKIVKPI